MDFCVFFKKEEKSVSLKKNKKTDGLFFKKKRVFLNPDCLSIFSVIFPWLHDLEQVKSLSLWLDVGCTLRVYVPGIEECENYWHLNT